MILVVTTGTIEEDKLLPRNTVREVKGVKGVIREEVDLDPNPARGINNGVVPEEAVLDRCLGRDDLEVREVLVLTHRTIRKFRRVQVTTMTSQRPASALQGDVNILQNQGETKGRDLLPSHPNHHERL
jgi:hypothetical protein